MQNIPKYVYTNIYSGHNFLRRYIVKFTRLTNERTPFILDLKIEGSIFL
jgi:hypothetical protein